MEPDPEGLRRRVRTAPLEMICQAPVPLTSRLFLRKPLAVVAAEESESKLERHLGLFDLLCLGIGGTIGSGVFVLCGLIAHEYAGPAVVASWIVAGFGCVLSGLNYAEMSSRVPSAGSSYAYTFVALGELPAVVAGWCLTLEYGISASAVARSWAEKLIKWSDDELGGYPEWLEMGDVNPLAGIMCIACMLILLRGVDAGRQVTNFFTGLKLLVVGFMIVGGLLLFKADNLKPFAPHGSSGIMRGATSAFFGFLGYDEVCCMAAEAKDPHRNLPLAVGGSIVGVTVLSSVAALALVGMQYYEDIDSDSGFADAFGDRGWEWAQNLVAVGELLTLPLVVFISYLAQPRLQYAMAEDGLLPSIFARVDANGNLSWNIFISGVVITTIALFVPFSTLDSVISAGVLVAFNMTNVSLVVTRRRHTSKSGEATRLMLIYTGVTFVGALVLRHLVDAEDVHRGFLAFPIVVLLGAAYLVVLVDRTCPEINDTSYTGFRVPLVPYLPSLGIFVNWYLVAQLEWSALLWIFCYVSIAVVWYLCYGLRNSVGNRDGWMKKLEVARSVSPDTVTDALLFSSHAANAHDIVDIVDEAQVDIHAE